MKNFLKNLPRKVVIPTTLTVIAITLIAIVWLSSSNGGNDTSGATPNKITETSWISPTLFWMVISVASVFVVIFVFSQIKNLRKIEIPDLDKERILQATQKSLQILGASLIWFVIVGIFWMLSGRFPEIWFFLWRSNKEITLLTALLLLIWSFLRFYSSAETEKAGRKNRAASIFILAQVALYVNIFLWVLAIVQIDFFKSYFESKPANTVMVTPQETKPTYKILSEFVATQDRWSAPYQTPTDKESGGGFYIDISGPVRIRTTYFGKITEMVRKPGDTDGVGNAETLEFRAVGNEGVRVKIMTKVRG